MIEKNITIPEINPLHFPIIAVHASAVKAPDGALLFLGHANAGKSSISHLLAGWFPKIADDSVYLAYQSGGWQVTNADRRAFEESLLPAPPSENDPGTMATLDWMPLQAVIRIFQAPVIRLEKISDRSTCKHLADAAFEIIWQQEGVERVRNIFSTVAQISRQYPGWELSFTLDHETCELVAAYFS